MSSSRSHGGARNGAGRKPLYSEPMQKTTVLLPRHYIAALKRIGNGNLAAGIRRLVQLSGIARYNRE